jgi:hypothetical protein
MAGGCGLAELGRKWPFGLGFKRGLPGENESATENTSRGLGWRDGDRSGLPMARHSEQLPRWEGKRKGGSRPVNILTPRRISGGGSQR